ncbi:hypothetical protein OIE66_38875 [Nonomuraea sp. NBC_01738]|uniref:hypothetical protein n=1 Tax=Nonomuraea sp. NBC_01738 TaxID=2976003 RepID=UPI002E0EBD0A|nr:hypothetical protein OIE66_38875 [Nonomuraea sp. NBC_01738]
MKLITQAIIFHTGAGSELVSYFTYDPASPLHVEIAIPLVTMVTIPRETLMEGTNAPAAPHQDCYCVHICLHDAGPWWVDTVLPIAPSEGLHGYLPRLELGQFLAKTFTIIPYGKEIPPVDWDGERPYP